MVQKHFYIIRKGVIWMDMVAIWSPCWAAHILGRPCSNPVFTSKIVSGMRGLKKALNPWREVMAICIFQVCGHDWKWLFANLDEESNGLTSGAVSDGLSEWEQLPGRAYDICARGHANARFLKSFMTVWLWGQNIESYYNFYFTLFQVLFSLYVPNWHSKRFIWIVPDPNVLLIGLNRPYQ